MIVATWLQRSPRSLLQGPITQSLQPAHTWYTKPRGKLTWPTCHCLSQHPALCGPSSCQAVKDRAFHPAEQSSRGGSPMHESRQYTVKDTLRSHGYTRRLQDLHRLNVTLVVWLPCLGVADFSGVSPSMDTAVLINSRSQGLGARSGRSGRAD